MKTLLFDFFSFARFGFASGLRYLFCFRAPLTKTKKDAAAIANAGVRFKTAVLSSLLILVFSGLVAQTQPDSIQPKAVSLDEVTVSATRANSKTPVTFSNLTKKEIEQRNLGQDIPQLLNFM